MMDWQTIIAYGIVIWAFSVVIRSVFKAFQGKATLPKCPGCQDECEIKDPAGDKIEASS